MHLLRCSLRLPVKHKGQFHGKSLSEFAGSPTSQVCVRKHKPGRKPIRPPDCLRSRQHALRPPTLRFPQSLEEAYWLTKMQVGWFETRLAAARWVRRGTMSCCSSRPGGPCSRAPGQWLHSCRLTRDGVERCWSAAAILLLLSSSSR